VLEVRYALIVRLEVPVHTLDAHLVTLDIVVPRIPYVQVARYLLALLLLAVLLVLEVGFETLDVTFEPANCGLLGAALALEGDGLGAEFGVLDDEESDLLEG
jgi:hypothetical protein